MTRSVEFTDSRIGRWRRWLVGSLGVALLAFLACCIYLPTLHYEMIFDDEWSIIDNESIRNLTPLFGPPGGHGPLKPQLANPLTARPVVNLAMAINYHFGQLDPRGYRLTHVILHILVAIILWLTVAATLRQPSLKNRFEGYRHSLALFAALLWMVHPTHSETVVYLTQRTDLLAGFFYALTTYLAIRFWDSNHWISRITWCFAAVASSVCGMLSKEMMASVPAMVIVYEWTFIGGSLWTMIKRSWMLHLGLMLSWAPLAALYIYGYTTPLAGFSATDSLADWWMTQSNSFFVYWRLLFAPWPLLLHYHVPPLTSLADAWPGVIGIATYSMITAYMLWRRTATGFALLWFLAVLSPTLVVPLPREEIVERRMYIPLLAMIPYLSIGVFVVAQSVRKRIAYPSAAKDLDTSLARQVPFGFALSLGLTFALVVASAVICYSTLPRLRNNQIIWEEVLKHRPGDTFAIAAQGNVEYKQGNKELGIAKFKFAFDTDPKYGYFRLLLLNALDETKQYASLVEACRRIHSDSPDNPTSNFIFATALEKNGQVDEAISMYRRVILTDPLHGESHSCLATLLAERNEVIEAIKHFEIATRIKPDFMNCMNLMGLYISTKQNEKAFQTAKLLVEAARKEQPLEVVEILEERLRQMENQLRMGNAIQ